MLALSVRALRGYGRPVERPQGEHLQHRALEEFTDHERLN